MVPPVSPAAGIARPWAAEAVLDHIASGTRLIVLARQRRTDSPPHRLTARLGDRELGCRSDEQLVYRGPQVVGLDGVGLTQHLAVGRHEERGGKGGDRHRRHELAFAVEQ